MRYRLLIALDPPTLNLSLKPDRTRARLLLIPISRWRAVAKEWNYTRQAEADLTASRETIEELLIVNSRHAEQARLAVAAQPAAIPVLGGDGVSAKMRRPHGTSSAVEYSRYNRTSSSSSSAAAARIASRSSSGVTPMTRRAQLATALLSSDDSDDA
eukprot:COSAG02_NODE_3065_length_7434_cov_6.617996_4_plen_157_part_00